MVVAAEIHTYAPVCADTDTDPATRAVRALEHCLQGERYLHASGAGAYKNGDWARDADEIGEAFLAIGHERGIDIVESLLDDYLRYSPAIPFRRMQYNHMLYQVNIPIPSGKVEHKIPRLKELFNANALVGEHPFISDTFTVLKLAAHFCTSPHVAYERKKKFWNRHQADLGMFIAEFTRPSSPFMAGDGLVLQAPLTSRADCLYKSGKEFQTNVKWYMTLGELSRAAGEMGNTAWRARFGAEAAHIREKINEVFWDEQSGHYLDWVDKSGKKYDHLDSLAHSLAIIAGIPDKQRSEKMAGYMLRHVYDGENRMVATVDKEYSPDLFEWIVRAVDGTAWFNCGDKGVFWPEMTAVFARALLVLGLHEEARVLIRSLDELLTEHGTLHETYGRDRQPITYRRKVLNILSVEYKSAGHFGMALAAYLTLKECAADM